jgi:hypothetical protein
MLTKTLFAKWMTTLHKRFSKDADQHVVELYYEHLSQLSDAEFETAAKSIFTNDEFWPAPKRFIDLARGTTKDAANREWALLIDACTRNNTNPPLSPAGILAMRRAGGWREIAYAEGPNKQEQLKRLFLAAYETDAQQRQHGQLQNSNPRLLS